MNLGDRGRRVIKLNEQIIHGRHYAKFFIGVYRHLCKNGTVHIFICLLERGESPCKFVKYYEINIRVRI